MVRPIEDGPRYTTVKDYTQVLRRHKFLIVFVGLLFALAMYLHDHGEARTYESVAKIQFSDQTINPGLFDTIVPQDVAPDQRAAIHAEDILTVAVASKAAQALHLPASDGLALLTHISAQAEAITDLIDVTALSTTAQGAANLANAYANAAVAQAQQNLASQYQQEVAGAQRQINALAKTPGTAYQRVLLENQLQALKQGASVVHAANLASPALAPNAPSSPETSRDTLLAGITGLVIAILIAFIREAFDNRYVNAALVARELELPTVGMVRDGALGRTPAWSGAKRRLTDPDVEAIRILRSKLLVIDPERPVKTILVTSSLPQEGKSTVAMAFAASCAQAGRKTLLLECDLRVPTLAGRLGLIAEPGLSDCLVTDTDPRQTFTTTAPGGTRGRFALRKRDAGPAEFDDGSATPVAFDCIVAGSPSARPAELLGSDAFATLLTGLKESYDVVVIDAAPLLPVADTLELLPLADCVALCVRVSRTSRDHARAGKVALEELSDAPIGLVLTGLRPRDGYDVYGYTYAGGRSAARRPWSLLRRRGGGASSA